MSTDGTNLIETDANQNLSDDQADAKFLTPPNYTKTFEDLKIEKTILEAESQKEKDKRMETTIRRVKLVILITALLLQIGIVICLIKYSFSSKDLQESQIKLSGSVEKFIEAEMEVAKQVGVNKDDISKSNLTILEHESRIKSLEENAEKVEALSIAVTKVNKLAVMNRNRIYASILEKNSNIEGAFKEENLAGEDIQTYTESILLAIVQREQRLDAEKVKEKVKVEEKTNPVVKEKKDADIKVEIVKETEKEKLFTPPNISDDKTEVKVKKDYLFFLKPWKWFRSDKQTDDKK
jgi:hypothetical protein